MQILRKKAPRARVNLADTLLGADGSDLGSDRSATNKGVGIVLTVLTEEGER